MKSLLLLLISMTFSITAFANSQSFECQVRSSNERAMDFEAEFHMSGDGEVEFVADLDGERMREQGTVRVVPGTDSLYILTFGNGPDTMQFSINTDQSIDLVSEYVQNMGDRFSLSPKEARKLRKKVLSLFSQGRKINGTQLILAEVAGFLSCQKI